MATRQAVAILRHFRGLAGGHLPGPASDRELLGRFVAGRDEAAFAEVVRRHGALVLGLCRRVLGHPDDAEDAFQATFLTLARKAGSTAWGNSVGGWLYGVARHLALKARAAAARRAAHEGRARPRPPADPLADVRLREAQAILDEELARLPEKYRGPIVLCCLEGAARDEAAQQLGWPLATLKSRLEQGRDLLRRRLARRGLTLSAVLAGLTLGRDAGRAAPALVVATSAAAVRLLGADTAALVRGAGKSAVAARGKVVAALTLTAGLLAAGAGVLARQQPLPIVTSSQTLPQREAPRPDSPTPDRESAFVEKGESVTVSSRVLGPDGKPLAGAEVTVWWYMSLAGWVAWQDPAMHSVRPRFGATTGADGRFRFTFTSAEMTHTLLTGDGKPWHRATLVASAKGYGPAWVWVMDLGKGDVTLRLVKDDVPVKGRVLDLQGKPVAGASVRVIRLSRPSPDHGWLGQDTWAGYLGTVTTGKDGRFTLTGIGRDRAAVVQVSGPAIETRVVQVATKAPARVELVVGPTKVIEGTVTAGDTGKPLAGAWVYGNEHNYCNSLGTRPVRAQTDAKGRFRLVGLPKAGSYELSVYPAEGQPYLMRTRKVADSEGLKALAADLALRRGVPVRFRLIDRETGKVVRGLVHYEVNQNNPLYSEAVYSPGERPSREFMRVRGTDQDGYVRFVAFPGPGAVFAHTGYDNPPYLLARLDPADAAKGRYPLDKGNPGNGFLDLHHGYRCLDPDMAKDRELTFDIFFTKGVQLKGTLLGPDGKAVRGATAYGTTFDASALRPDGQRRTPLRPELLSTAAFTARGVYPGEPRTLSFIHKERKLICHVVVNGKEKGPLAVRLRPWGALKGRLVGPDGKPLAGVKVRLFCPPLPRPGLSPAEINATTDAAGRFRVEGMLPGEKHELGFALDKKVIVPAAGAPVKGLSVAEGEVKDVGDIKVSVRPGKK
jgi:RNA polymerase sigma factor (sigma-70 family)